ncbi:hypothetical protein [Streptomyces sp. NPDC056600]|uniref:hypothetical protein n=1 Tax=Streptomyces sp. NPDC056600 TaxID=3345874 RepID=UPI0036A2E775
MNDGGTYIHERHAVMSDGRTRDKATAETEELLRADAILPPGTLHGGDRAVPVFARTYRHPGLEGRIAVRLMAEDRTGDTDTGFLGLELRASRWRSASGSTVPWASRNGYWSVTLWTATWRCPWWRRWTRSRGR